MTFRDNKQIIYGLQYINPSDNYTIIDCRIYTGKKSFGTYYAAVWINDNKGKKYSHGVGIAGGYGYHKGSQAIEQAIMEMGIKLNDGIGGHGYDACSKAFSDIMSALGYTSFITAVFHA
jgi:hypothetical protein